MVYSHHSWVSDLVSSEPLVPAVLMLEAEGECFRIVKKIEQPVTTLVKADLPLSECWLGRLLVAEDG